MSLYYKQISFLGATENQPFLEVNTPSGQTQILPFTKNAIGRNPQECWWQVCSRSSKEEDWNFRIIYDGHALFPHDPEKYYSTSLKKVWIQDGEVFSYLPAHSLSPSKVIKIPEFEGNLFKRPLYIYLPRGYEEQTDRFYPVIYMHDGQNCFEAFLQDSYSGSWRADRVADATIKQGLMQECIIVGVSHGSAERLWEYLPPYSVYPLEETVPDDPDTPPMLPKQGRADQTLIYYRDYVLPYISSNYRALNGRNTIATCGSSLGGLFSYYIAWEFPDLARQHAVVSPSYWITQKKDSDVLEGIERIVSATERRDVRMWLDSGTRYAPGFGDDGMYETIKARDALIKLGYTLGEDLQYYLAKNATHHESAWSARLHLIFQFLFPLA